MAAWLFVAWVAAQATLAPKPIETKHVTVRTSAGPMGSGKLLLHVDVTPRDKMRVYAPGQPGYIAIELKLDADAPVTASGKPKYPAGEKLFMPALNETQLVYSTPFRITQEVTPRAVPDRAPVIRGSLRYQACDDAICYKPATIALSWPIPNSEPR
ncbi:MAG TPA: protein-disulfide reductase DsbD domain-containing protein [Vicinamibacterales bacterium]|nr:protein-disulfide reductase DsbD domain-containing protein [Vicinamibacterales bacterium]